MSYQEFVDYILQELREFYGNDAEVSVHTVVGNNNGCREALHIRFTVSEREAIPSIYLDTLYESYIAEDYKLDAYVDIVIQMRKDYNPDNMIKDSLRKLMDWGSIKDRIYPVLVSREDNECYLANHVYTSYLDLAVVYEVRISEGDHGIVSSVVTYSMLNNYEVSKAELHRQALENMKKDGYTMGDMLYQMFGCFMGEIDVENVELEAGKMYILSNRRKRHGAACLLYEDFLKEKLGNTTAFIIPSSIHETLFVPVMEGMSAEAFNEMICQVNEAYVKTSERLSNHCYYWDGVEQKVKMAA